MDTNYLLAREQISLMRARTAASPAARAAHAGLARGYGAMLAQGTLFPHRMDGLVAAMPDDPSENPDRGRFSA
ncbi:MAG: hypothetical protein K2P68_11095 [Sphingomonas sp.]|nr:hypothetical protein [Sphingomonas sp.]